MGNGNVRSPSNPSSGCVACISKAPSIALRGLIRKSSGDCNVLSSEHIKAFAASWDAFNNLCRETLSPMRLFCGRVFRELLIVDCNHTVTKKLQGSRRNSFRPQLHILLTIIEYLYEIKDDSFATKAKLRSLGRSHARANISKDELETLSDALIRSIITILPPKFLVNAGVVEAWSKLLYFVVEEMTLEKVQFSNHCSGDYSVANKYSPSNANASDNYIATESGRTESSSD